jgi:hypothetical protein
MTRRTLPPAWPAAPPDRKKTLSHRKNCRAQRAPYEATLASSTAEVCSRRDDVAVAAPAKCTATLDTNRPVKARAQKGTTWRTNDGRPARDQTQRRLSSNEGTVPTAVATKFDSTPGIPASPTNAPRTERLVAVEIAETEAYLTSRLSTGICRTVAFMTTLLASSLRATLAYGRRLLGARAIRA